MRCVPLGGKSFLFMGSEGGGKSAGIAYTLINNVKLNALYQAEIFRRKNWFQL
jgi:transposase